MFQPRLVHPWTEIPIPKASPEKTPPDDARRLPCCSGEAQCRSRFRKGAAGRSPAVHKGAITREAGAPRERKLPVPWCLSRIRRCRTPDLTNPLRSLRPPSPRLPCAHNLPHSRARTGSSHRLFPFTAFAPSESRGRGRNLVKEGPQGEIPRRHHRDMHRAMHRAMHRSLHRYMPAPPGAATGPL